MSFFTTAVEKQTAKAESILTLGVQLIAPSLRAGKKRDGSPIDGLTTMWATCIIGETNQHGDTVNQKDRIRLKIWDDSVRISVPEGSEVESFDQALRQGLFFAELVGQVEDVKFKATDKRDGLVTEHLQIKVLRLNLVSKLEVLEETDLEESGEDASF